MPQESLIFLFYLLWLVLRTVVGSTSWPKVTSIVQSNGTQSVSGDLPEMKAVGLAVIELYYACTFCRTEVFPSHFAWRATFTAFGNGGKTERTGDSDTQETGAITVFFQNGNSTINGMCKQ